MKVELNHNIENCLYAQEDRLKSEMNKIRIEIEILTSRLTHLEDVVYLNKSTGVEQ